MLPQSYFSERRRRLLTFALVFATALLTLAFRIEHVGLAESFVDPINQVPAQDEAVYSSTAIHMAQSGGWLTPMFLGRYAFYKPPLVYWACGAALKIFGPSNWSLRLPSLIAAALVVVMIWAWLWETRSLGAPITGALLLLSDRVFYSMARVALTDMLLALCIVIAAWCVYRDRKLAESRYFWTFGLATGTAIMTKGVAGFLPLLILIGAGAPLKRILQICAVAAGVAGPWHLDQLATHTRWFWAEYIVTEHFTWGLAAPGQSSDENQLFYYIRRLALMDPVLSALALAGLFWAIRERNRLLLVWVTVMFLALVGFGYRNTSYLLPLIPALCLLAACFANRLTIAALVLLFVVKVFCWNQVWGLPYRPEHPTPSVAALRTYAAQHRMADLIIIAPDDEFVSSTVPIRHVRYGFFQPKPTAFRLPLDFEYLGITVTTDQFNRMDSWRPVFEQRLREWGLPSAEPIATVILLTSVKDIAPLVQNHPDSDFSLPVGFAGFADNRHLRWQPSAERVFLLAANSSLNDRVQ